MESKTIKIQDGVLDIAMRLLFILHNCEMMMSRDRLAVYCYISSTGNSKRIGRASSYVGIEKTIGKSIHYLMSKQLLTFSHNADYNLYGLTNIGLALVLELNKESYSSIINSEINKANSLLKDVSDDELSKYIKMQI